MGYVNKDRRIVTVSAAEKRYVKRLRRRAEQRELRGERMRAQARRATKRGWWYA
jgi:hypothetical protein